VDALAELWTHLEEFDVGFCFDTCHAHAAGEDLVDVVKRTFDATGRIDVLHANDSRDPPGTGADRHANFDKGMMDNDVVLEMIRSAEAPVVICETPWPGISEDMAWLRRNL
ncbi:MAG: TIM barrel protein, partial [Actinomycetota bacterium]